MTREDRRTWEDLDEDDQLEAYETALDNLRDMEGRYRVVRAQPMSVGLWICALTVRAPIMLTLWAVASVGRAAQRGMDWADTHIPGPTLPKRKPNAQGDSLPPRSAVCLLGGRYG